MRSRRSFLILCTVLLVYASLELCSFALYYVMHGKAFSFADMNHYRHTVLGWNNGEKEMNNRFDAVGGKGASYGGGRFSLHPYLGYVRDPETLAGVTPYGFLAEQDPLAASNDPTAAIVAITGASVAEAVYRESPGVLRDALKNLPAFRGKHIVLVSFAVPSYKEPQQFLAVAYYLALGGRVDMLINLDGKNEATDAYYLFTQGVYPAYPSGWGAFFPGNFDPGNLADIGVETLWKNTRHVVAAVADWGSFSVTVTTFWDLLDHFIGTRIFNIETTLRQRHDGKKLPYFIAGPDKMRRANEAQYADFQSRLWMATSVEIMHLAKAHHFYYFHFLQPNQYVPGSKTLSSVEKANAFDERSINKKTVMEVYPKLQALMPSLTAQGVPIYDLTGIYAKIPETIYIDSCCHVNRQGNDIMAGVIAARITDYFKHHSNAP